MLIEPCMLSPARFIKITEIIRVRLISQQSLLNDDKFYLN